MADLRFQIVSIWCNIEGVRTVGRPHEHGEDPGLKILLKGEKESQGIFS